MEDVEDFAKAFIYPSIYSKRKEHYIDQIYYLSKDGESDLIIYEAMRAVVLCTDACKSNRDEHQLCTKRLVNGL